MSNDVTLTGEYIHDEVAAYLADRSKLIGGKLDIGAMRPWIGTDGRSYITVHAGGDVTDPGNYKSILVSSATLRKDEWKQLDEAVLRVSQSRLVGINDLLQNNLIYRLGNPMGTTVLEWHDVSSGMEAELTMDGITRSRNDRVVYQTNYLPIPLLHVDYTLNSRVLAASRNLGNGLDTTSAEIAARKINDKLESMLFTDTSYAWGDKDDRSRNKIYSYINFPDVNHVTLTKSWTDSTKTPAEIIQDMLNLKKASINAKHPGPWTAYIPTVYETVLDEDYDSSTPGTTIRERILKISNIKDIKVADLLPDDHVVLVQMTNDVVRLVYGLPIQNVEWKTEGNFVTHFKVLTMQVPQIRSDQNGNCGVSLLA